ncbi:hypothetical protein LUZ63_001898 [Rhynchospora breviuscula]|uniref:Uncharacterized protein n=1 Tax=Rhynchospora breviuscula TaxID=2022672 RepID=A0A9Q0HXC7_9POAL|nr:hypothetical protein LUZ63_001898 [Rhynchospora breviuscula]
MASSEDKANDERKKRALDALERRFAVAKAELNQVDRFKTNPSEKDLRNPSTPPQLSSTQKGKSVLSSGSALQQKISHSFDGENHPIYSELSEAVHERLLQGATMDPNRRDAVEKVLVDIMRKGDETGGFVSGVKKIKKENWVLLDNFISKDDNSLANARSKSLMSHSKRSRSHMSMKQHRQCGSFIFSKEFHNFERFKPMHAMWKGYICELVKDAGKKQLTERLLTADLHGAFLSVVESKTVSYVGISGIMIRETTETFGIISQNNKFKGTCFFFIPGVYILTHFGPLCIQTQNLIILALSVVPKAGSVFMLQADSWMVTLCGDMLSANERSKKSTAQLRLQPLLR